MTNAIEPWIARRLASALSLDIEEKKEIMGFIGFALGELEKGQEKDAMKTLKFLIEAYGDSE